MLRRTLFNIIRLEHQQLEDQIAEEQRRPSPDGQRLSYLQAQENSLRREMESFPEP